MQFVTIHGNGFRAYDSIIVYVASLPGSWDQLNTLINASRFMRYRTPILQLYKNDFYISCDYDAGNWWAEGLSDYAGRGIELDAGIQQQIGSN